MFIIQGDLCDYSMEFKKQVGERLAQARKQAGFTQKQVGEKLGILQQAYARFESGVYELNYEQIFTLCKLFDCSADYLLGLSDI